MYADADVEMGEISIQKVCGNGFVQCLGRINRKVVFIIIVAV